MAIKKQAMRASQAPSSRLQLSFYVALARVGARPGVLDIFLDQRGIRWILYFLFPTTVDAFPCPEGLQFFEVSRSRSRMFFILCCANAGSRRISLTHISPLLRAP